MQRTRKALESLRSALKAGKAPRARRSLREAVRLFKSTGRTAEAMLGLQTEAMLELRRGNPQRAVAPTRAALRLARRIGSAAELEETLDLLAVVYSRLGEHEKAAASAGEWLGRARGRGDGEAAAQALLRLALIRWNAGEAPGALCLAEEALAAARSRGAETLAAQADWLLGILLLQSGCPTAAGDRFSRSLRTHPDTEGSIRTLIGRGWSRMCLGRADAAAQDFQRARRLAGSLPDARLEVEAMAALSAAEAGRARVEADPRRLARSAALAARAARRARRLRDPRLEEALQQWTAVSGQGGAAAAPDGQKTAKEAAEALVNLARRTDSLTIASACLREVERLATLAAGEPPYHCALRIPLALE